MNKQTTIERTVKLAGKGLHKGNPSVIVFLPAEANHGIVFRRSDLPEQPLISATLGNVQHAHRGTTIGRAGAVVHTVEHVLASVMGLGIDNVLIEIEGDEPPACDGSAELFIKSLSEAGIRQLDADVDYCQLKESFWLEENGKTIVYRPSSKLEITFSIDYPNFPMLQQTHHVVVDTENFAETIGYARTFGFFEEHEGLKSQNLALGGSMENAIVFDKNGEVMNPGGLKQEKECVTHKILDLIGDLALIGTRIKGHIIAHRTGHAINIKIGKMICNRLKLQKERKDTSMMNIEQIKEILPHRYPFLLVDRILSIVPGESALGIKNVTANEEFFNGHFPGKAVMPGVLLVEAMAQVAGVLFLSQPEHKGKLPFFVGIDKIRFRRPVVPGDRLEFSVKTLRIRGNTGKVAVEAKVETELVASGELMFTIL